ncbi:hypothetical protein FPOAC2_01093 [Fusarium poae]|uniref:hypothetical protein n=1 Tax=Fusarium poae TaxID=36050 RepID=UPI001CEBF92C|nr:hypothetical protein FPOAC1_001029 [Fusarium poae]KAG8675053.1 hypothetical protein FPOAC1_001029 [Fusarium poae]
MSIPTLSASAILKDSDYPSYPLHFFIAIGNLGTLQFLLNKASLDTINESDDKWGAPLHIAVHLDNIRGIPYGCSELRYLEDPKLWGRVVQSDLTPLHVAARVGAMTVDKYIPIRSV